MWKQVVIEDLKKYGEIQRAQPLLQSQIKMAKERFFYNEQIGDTHKNTLDKMVKIKKMEQHYQENQFSADEILAALHLLEEREKTVLHYFYIDRPFDYIEILSEILNVERSQIYRIKDKALTKLSKMLYGIV